LEIKSVAYGGRGSSALRIYKELTPMKKDRVDLDNKVVWIPDSKTPNGVAEVPLTELAVAAFLNQMEIVGNSPNLFPSENNPTGHRTTFKTAWVATLRRAKVPVLSDRRSALDLRVSFERRRRRRRVGDSTLTARRCEAVQEVLADEALCRSSIARRMVAGALGQFSPKKRSSRDMSRRRMQ